MKVLPIDVVGGGLVLSNGVDERITGSCVLDEQAADAHGDGTHFARVDVQKEDNRKSCCDVSLKLLPCRLFFFLFQTRLVEVPHLVELDGKEDKEGTHVLHIVERSAADDGDKSETEVSAKAVNNSVGYVECVGEAPEDDKGCGVNTQHVDDEDVTAATGGEIKRRGDE